MIQAMKSNGKKVVVIGGGIGGLGTACLLSKRGYEVTLVEKNENLGGRANIFTAEGFTFDMGPSWYLMPDVFENFYKLVDEDINDHLDIVRLSPSYRVFFPGDKEVPVLDMESDLEKDLPTLEKLEPGVTDRMRSYLKRSEKQYGIAQKYFMHRNYNSVWDFLKWEVAKEGRSMNPLQTMEKYLNKWFRDERLKKILEYTLVFLGSAPSKTPALYNVMNHVDFGMGVFYPRGGIYTIIDSFKNMNEKFGTKIMTSSPVKKINVENKSVTGVELESGEILEADYVVSNADMWFTETKLLDKDQQTFPEKYWEKATMAPTAFIMYLGLNTSVPNLQHHNLRFCKDWKQNFVEIFDKPQLPNDPSYYVCKPTHTDRNIAPEGQDILFVLVPLPCEFIPTEKQKKSYRDKIIGMMESDLDLLGLEDMITYERSYWGDDFGRDYNAYKGNALGGMAHTLKQTLFRPKNFSKKVKNLYYAGAGTNPGIGVPTSLISSQLAYKRIENITHPHPLTSLDG
ncbi:MAG: phytoene desaturase [Saprospiraceae bacterium]|jgi:phytoene desaturase